MGLAASQARFLCITARKADCEYKTTDLAQQKLNITNQLSQISNDYANAMNATKLMWSNEGVSADYGLSYGLLMTPSAINDYNAYMVTSPSGAAILNSQYAAAAKAAGISRNGGIGSQAQRDKFIEALGGQGLITESTSKSITINDGILDAEDPNEIQETSGIAWNPYAGMGDTPMNKVNAGSYTLTDLILSEAIGKVEVDWGLFNKTHPEQLTEEEVKNRNDEYKDLLEEVAHKTMSNDIIIKLRAIKNDYDLKVKNGELAAEAPEVAAAKKLLNQALLMQAASKGTTFDNLSQELKDLLFKSTNENGNAEYYSITDYISANSSEMWNNIKTAILTEKTEFNDKYGKDINGNYKLIPGTNTPYIIATSANLFTNENSLDCKNSGLALIQNGIICTNSDTIKTLTIGDILATDIVLFQNANNVGDHGEDIDKFIRNSWYVFESIIAKFGYSTTENLSGKGLNVDEASQKALEFAYNMTKRMFSRVESSADKWSSNTSGDDTYKNALAFNMTVARSDNTRVAVSLTNMLSAFLTYYDNSLRGMASEYVVGRSTEQSVYVTDNPDYCYIAGNIYDADAEEPTTSEKTADYFDQIYNYILAHGWREDASVDDNEYIEALIKDGRYSLASLNEDGYYYQSRYNDTGYLIEVSDTDAIARAEAEFTAKKAELTYKEDSIDLKTKKLDTEISSLTQELESVKKLMSGSIEKTFQLYQQ